MGNYTTALIIFGLVFSTLYIKKATLFGKIVTSIFVLLYLLIYTSSVGIAPFIPPFYVYTLGLCGVCIYTITQSKVNLIQKIVLIGFTTSIFTYNLLAFLGVDLQQYKIIPFISLSLFGYIFYEKEAYESELSFLNLMFIECLMSLSIMLNN